MGRLRPQLTPDVRVLVLTDGGEWPIGTKRQRLLDAATAEWVSFVDDDDMVPAGYVDRICEAMTDQADVVGFRLRYFEDGEEVGYAVHSYNAAEHLPLRDAKDWWRRFNRAPNHLNPVRRSFAVRVGYKPLNHGEDGDYAERLAKLKPREAFVDAPMYDYLYRRNRKGERTNENRTGKQ